MSSHYVLLSFLICHGVVPQSNPGPAEPDGEEEGWQGEEVHHGQRLREKG